MTNNHKQLPCDKPKLALFCGTFASEDEPEEYLHIHYDDELGEAYSLFMHNFGIDYYDEDMTEMGFYPDGDLVSALREHSYADSFDGQIYTDIAQHHGANCLFLIYDYQNYFDKLKLNIDPDTKMALVGVYGHHKE